ncbi:MAG: ROK family protein [Firmicutes bacterium]|nr:ROK family protein [Bacillota bacterium]
MARSVLAIDIGGTKILAGVVAESGEVLSRAQVATGAGEGPGPVIARIVAAARTALQQAGQPVERVGVGCPGPLSVREGLVLSPPNLPGWNRIPLPSILERELGLPVAFDNDANLAALGEYRFGAGHGARCLLYVTVSTGIGGGVVLEGRLWRGPGEMGGEIGHVVVRPGGPRCSCGRAGCLEAIASGPALARATGLPSAREVVAAAREGDARALAVLREAGQALGQALAVGAGFLNPDRIVLGGSVALGAGDLLFGPLMATLEEALLPEARAGLQVLPAALGGDAGLLGAAALALAEG